MNVTLEKITFRQNQPYSIRVQQIVRTPIHWHEGVTEILVPLRGRVRVTAAFEQLTVQEGEFYFINNQALHSIQSDSGAVAALIQVNLPYFADQFKYLSYMFFRSTPLKDSLSSYSSSFKDIGPEEKARFLDLLVDIIKLEIFKGPEHVDLYLQDQHHLGNRLAYAMVFQFNWLRFLKSTEGMLSASHLDRYHRIVKYIQEHSGERISLSDIVASEYITKTYFSQFWKKFSSYSFTQRVNYERILKSEFLLLKGENILKISEQCGFSDVKYYYQNFRKWYGCLPSEHRKRCQDYTERGADYEEIGALRCKREFQSYWERVLFSEHNPEGEGNKPDSLQGFMKLKDPTSSSCVNVHSTTILMLNPFKSDVLHLDDMGKVVFQWDTLDSLVKLSTDTGTSISVGIFTDSVEPRILLEGIQHFLEGSAIRYGKGKMKLWRYQLYYENPILFDKSISIEKLIAERIKGAIIHHYFQI